SRNTPLARGFGSLSTEHASRSLGLRSSTWPRCTEPSASPRSSTDRRSEVHTAKQGRGSRFEGCRSSTRSLSSFRQSDEGRQCQVLVVVCAPAADADGPDDGVAGADAAPAFEADEHWVAE